MKKFRQYLQDDEPITLVAKDKKLRRHKPPKDITDKDLYDTETIDELAIKPNTARLFAIALISNVLKTRDKVQQKDDIDSKINELSVLMTQVAYMLLLTIATDQNDPTLLRKIRRR